MHVVVDSKSRSIYDAPVPFIFRSPTQNRGAMLRTSILGQFTLQPEPSGLEAKPEQLPTTMDSLASRRSGGSATSLLGRLLKRWRSGMCSIGRIVLGHGSGFLARGVALCPLALFGFRLPTLAGLALLALGLLFGLSAGFCLTILEIFGSLFLLKLLTEMSDGGGLIGRFSLWVGGSVGAASLAEDGVK